MYRMFMVVAKLFPEFIVTEFYLQYCQTTNVTSFPPMGQSNALLHLNYLPLDQWKALLHV